uniref:NAD(+) diphosphatase n=1 Tax=Plectus sambesii TaxID=2011161 RepID=A0A914XDI5_9BILA
MLSLIRQSIFSTQTTTRRASSYVNKMRTLEWWKNDDSAMKAEFTRGQFVLFLDKQPLVRSKERNAPGFNLQLLQHDVLKQALSDHGLTLKNSDAALLDATVADATSASASSEEEDLTAIFAVGLKSPPSSGPNSAGIASLSDSLSAALGGRFIDARLAMLSMEWNEEAKMVAKGQALLRWNRLYRKCPKCGSGLEMKASKTRADCSTCSRQFYPTLSPVAICLVRDESDEHCLLVRQPQTRKGVYTAIAGFCEPGESLEDAARREIAEEVGIELLSNVSYANLSQAWPFPNSSLMCSFIGVADRKIQPEVDHSELEAAKWFTREEVAAAFQATIKDPFLSSPADDPHHLSYIPPQGTIAHHMIKQWLQTK